MTEIIGTGTHGKRLWIRTPAGQWAPVPYGAGENDSIRSLNVWNGSHWLTPLSGYQVVYRQGDNRPSWNVYAPGVDWNDLTAGKHTYNPNFIYPHTNIQFTPPVPNYVRLAYMATKNDPKWRIVSLVKPIPTKIPNQSINHYFAVNPADNPAASAQTLPTDDLYFWPSTASGATASGGSSEPVPDPFNTAPAQASGRDMYGSLMSSIHRNYYNAQGTHGDGRPNYRWENQRVSLLIDLKAIRQRLTNDYPQRDLFWSGQYEPITSMTVKRIVIYAGLQLNAYIGDDNLTAQAFSGFTGELWCERGAATEDLEPSNDPDGWKTPVSYVTRWPTDTQPTGTRIHQQAVTDIGLGPMSSSAGYVGGITHTIDDPGDDNVKLTAHLPSPVSGSSTYSSSIHYIPYAIGIHYAVDGADVPEAIRHLAYWH